jgi:hypothetical protein
MIYNKGSWFRDPACRGEGRVPAPFESDPFRVFLAVVPG